MSWKRLLNPAFLVAALMLVGAAAGLRASVAALGIHTTKLPIEAADGLQMHSIPGDIPGFQWRPHGSDEIMTQETLETLGTENYLSRLYVRGNDEYVDFHVAYYTGMIDTVPHVPERCFVGGGMRKDGLSKVVSIPIDLSKFSPDLSVDVAIHPELDGVAPIKAYSSDMRPVRLPRGVENLSMLVTRFVDEQSNLRIHAGYFFIANGGLAPRAEEVRMLAFKPEDDYSYYCKVQFTSGSVESPEELAQHAAEMLERLLPEVVRRLPDWIEVSEGRYPPDNPRRAQAAAR